MKNKRDRSKKDPIPQLENLATRMKDWRETRPRGQRIPKELWQAATEMARIHGLNATAKELKLDYYDLQRRLRGGKARPDARAQTQFVELPALIPTSPGMDPGTLELVRPSGARLTLRLPNASPRQLLPLVQAFLRS